MKPAEGLEAVVQEMAEYRRLKWRFAGVLAVIGVMAVNALVGSWITADLSGVATSSFLLAFVLWLTGAQV